MIILSAVSWRRLGGPCWGSCSFNRFLKTHNKVVNAAHELDTGLERSLLDLPFANQRYNRIDYSFFAPAFSRIET